MSVIVKGMEMPEKCGSCDLFHAESPMHCTVVKGHKTVGAPYGMPRPEWCPLIETDDSDGWISVEDRLPKIGNTVLATRFISKDHTYVDMSSYQGQDIGWKSNFDTYYGTNPYKVMAWRPLPKPYKPKEDTQ